MNEFVDAEVWSLGTPIGRWSGMGPYYAMFPVSFARSVIEEYSRPGEKVIDPFCGRGTTNYVSSALGRPSFGCEVNPVGWVYASVKTDPFPRPDAIVQRIEELGRRVQHHDRIAENEFQEWAWSPDVLGFIRVARRELDWKACRLDRTLAAFLLVYLHAKIGGGLSNQMRQSKSMAPDYSVRWWSSRSMRPPQIDPVAFLSSRVEWRYSKGLPKRPAKARIFLGDARQGLSRHRGDKASLILTSPPYLDVTNYKYDNWIRLWALGGDAYPSWSTEHRHSNREQFTALMKDVFRRSQKRARTDATIVVRTDARKYTLTTTVYAILEAWPEHRLFGRRTNPTRHTQTALFGDKSKKPGEVDIIALPKGHPKPAGYIDLEIGM